jgi:hypothetical protein
MIDDTKEIDNGDGADSGIDDAEIACMSGHAEACEELRRLGWSSEQVDELEGALHGYDDFARCVASERRWLRSGSD